MKTFIPYQRLIHATEPNSVRLIIEQGEEFTVPTANVVSGGGFDSWAGRGYKGMGDKDYTTNEGRSGIGRSIDAIIDYATRETTLPPVEGIDAFIQPNGLVIFGVANSNHRAATAIARGQTELAVKGDVTFHLLNTNFIETEL